MPITATIPKPNIARTLKTAQETCTIGTSDTAFGTGLSVSITPRGNGSHFKITVRAFMEMVSGWEVIFNIHRAGARINQGLNAGNNWHGLAMATQSFGLGDDSNSTPEMLAIITLDTTGSTVGVPLAFSLVASSPGNRTLWVNRCFGTPQGIYETGTSEIIVEEILQ